jgi:hypothetical protein
MYGKKPAIVMYDSLKCSPYSSLRSAALPFFDEEKTVIAERFLRVLHPITHILAVLPFFE